MLHRTGIKSTGKKFHVHSSSKKCCVILEILHIPSSAFHKNIHHISVFFFLLHLLERLLVVEPGPYVIWILNEKKKRSDHFGNVFLSSTQRGFVARVTMSSFTSTWHFIPLSRTSSWVIATEMHAFHRFVRSPQITLIKILKDQWQKTSHWEERGADGAKLCAEIDNERRMEDEASNRKTRTKWNIVCALRCQSNYYVVTDADSLSRLFRCSSSPSSNLFT